MKPKPLVSIIIPFYRNTRWLEEAINSALDQTLNDCEVIIINDGSKEDISFILNKYKEKIRYFQQENLGAASARNKGIYKAQGEYIAFLDSDDLWDKMKLETQIEYMKKNNFLWSHTSYRRFNSKGIINEVSVKGYQNDVFPICIMSSPIATPCVVIKSDILKNDNSLRFHESMNVGEDTYLWTRLALKYKLGAINQPLTNVRIRGSNASLLAYSQIEYRSKIWSILKMELNEHTYKLNLLTRGSFELCCFYYNLLNCMPDKIKNSRTLIEILSKFIYVLPWGVFKIHKFFRRIKYENN